MISFLNFISLLEGLSNSNYPYMGKMSHTIYLRIKNNHVEI